MNTKFHLPLQGRHALAERPGRLAQAVAATAAALALSGCMSGPPETAPKPVDTRPVVETDASYSEQYSDRQLLDMRRLSAAVERAIEAQNGASPTESPATIISATSSPTPESASNLLPGWQILNNTHPDGTRDGAFLRVPSAPLLEIAMGDDGSLRYEDQTEGVIYPQEAGLLLGAVEYSKELLKSSMENGAVHSIRFRVFQPNQSPDDPTYEPQEESFFLSKDFTDGGKGNIYYFLPADEILDQKGVATMLRHEAIHGALRHGIDQFTAEDVGAMAEACTTIRDAAIQEATSYAYDITERLAYLRDHSDKKYAGSFDEVIHALQSDAYATLPLSKDIDEVVQCYIQNPLQAVAQAATQKGLDTKPLLEGFLDEKKGHVASTVIIDWQGLIEDDTIYAALREASFLRPVEEGPDTRGHSQQGAHEAMASFLNVALSFPDEAVYKLTGTDPKQLDAIDAVVRKSIGLIKQKHARPELNTWLDVRYGMFKKELDQAR